jgi:hypothetical protein
MGPERICPISEKVNKESRTGAKTIKLQTRIIESPIRAKLTATADHRAASESI